MIDSNLTQILVPFIVSIMTFTPHNKIRPFIWTHKFLNEGPRLHV